MMADSLRPRGLGDGAPAARDPRSPGLRRHLRLFAVLVFTCSTTVASGAQQQKDALTNDDLIRMTQAALEEGTILKLIESTPPAFDTSASGLIALKNAGVSDRVIHAAVAAGHGLPAQSSGLYPRPDEIGVYVNLREQLVPLKVEIITWRGGGMAKRVLLGTRGHVNGSVFKPLSPLRLDARPEFIVYCADGTVAEEYQLLRLWEKKDRREFRIATGGVIRASSGAGMNAIEVTVERVGVRLYRITPTLPLSPGEYGFLPPGALLSASAASSGKVYTFGIPAKR